jgi:hypothetical protein
MLRHALGWRIAHVEMDGAVVKAVTARIRQGFGARLRFAGNERSELKSGLML